MEDDDGFKFAVVALTALGTILYTIVNYIRTTAVEDDWYILYKLLIPIIFIFIIFLLLYVLIKGFYREMYGSDEKESKSSVSSIIYLTAFLMTLIVLFYIGSIIFLVKYPEYGYIFRIIFYFIIVVALLKYFLQEYRKETRKWIDDLKEFVRVSHDRITNKVNNLLSYLHLLNTINKFSNKISGQKRNIVFSILLILAGLAFFFNDSLPILSIIISIDFLIAFLLYKPLIPKKYSNWATTIVSILILVGIFLWYFSIFPFQAITKGDVTIDMDNVNYKGAPIPVSIRETGPNANLSIKLYQKDSGINLTEINNISLEPKHNPNSIISGEKNILIGNSLDNGKYCVFINSANLSVGYYELNVFSIKYDKNNIKGFYILNASNK